MENNTIDISVDQRLYSKDALLSVLYEYSGEYEVEQLIDENNDNIILVSLTPKVVDKQVAESANVIRASFIRSLIDQQLRININKEFGHIRDLIVEEAFKPITKE